MHSKIKSLAIILTMVVLLTACGPKPTPAVTSVATFPNATGIPDTAVPPMPTFTPLPPTPTHEPQAITVNGAGISVAEYNAEIQRLGASLKETGKTLQPVEEQKQVLDEFTSQLLLAAAAQKAGYQLDDAALQKHIDALTTQAGGADPMAAWMKANFYDSDSLKVALRRQMAAAWERDQITNAAPTTADQVHVRQMLLLDADTANTYYSRLQAGADFTTLAFVVDPDTGGDLGWFPQGYLLLPEIEKEAFSLKPGQYSPVIQTTYGYQIIYLIERDSQHPLSTDARRSLQQQLLNNWLKEQTAGAKIDILVPQP
jgi:peptidyl-prolyl cis-trans isomerase C